MTIMVGRIIRSVLIRLKIIFLVPYISAGLFFKNMVSKQGNKCKWENIMIFMKKYAGDGEA